MQGKATITVEVGAEWDAELLISLRQCVSELRGTMKLVEQAVVGSQDIQVHLIELPSGHVEAKAETYMGLCLTGPVTLVEQLVGSLKAKAGRSNG
jgi:hypothetical protein